MQAWLAHREIEALVPIEREKYKEQIPRPAKGANEHAEELETGMVPIGMRQTARSGISTRGSRWIFSPLIDVAG